MCENDASGVSKANEDERDSALRYKELYGPWVYNNHLTGKKGLFLGLSCFILETCLWIASFAFPLVFMIVSLINKRSST